MEVEIEVCEFNAVWLTLIFKIKDPKTGEEKPVTISVDDGIRPQTNMADLGKLKPAFKKDGTTTAGSNVVACLKSKLYSSRDLCYFNLIHNCRKC